MSDLYKNFRKSFLGYPKMIQIKNNKQTNKETKKHFYIDNILAKSCLIFAKHSENFLRVSQDDSNEKNTKKTNKQIKHFLDQQYIS